MQTCKICNEDFAGCEPCLCPQPQLLTRPQIAYSKLADWVRIGLTDDEILTMGGLPESYTIDTASLVALIRSHEEILAAE